MTLRLYSESKVLLWKGDFTAKVRFYSEGEIVLWTRGLAWNLDFILYFRLKKGFSLKKRYYSESEIVLAKWEFTLKVRFFSFWKWRFTLKVWFFFKRKVLLWKGHFTLIEWLYSGSKISYRMLSYFGSAIFLLNKVFFFFGDVSFKVRFYFQSTIFL